MKLLELIKKEKITDYKEMEKLYMIKLIKKIKIISILLLVVICIVSSVFLYISNNKIKSLNKEINDLKEEAIVLSPVAPKINIKVLNSEIKEVGKLVSNEYIFSVFENYSDSKQIKDWNIPFTEKSFSLNVDGVIKAGINLEKIEIKTKGNDKIIVKLPEAEILSYEIINEELLDEKNNIFYPISIDDNIELQEKIKIEMEERAISNGLLEKAFENAKEDVERLITADSTIRDNYIIEFEIIEAEK